MPAWEMVERPRNGAAKSRAPTAAAAVYARTCRRRLIGGGGGTTAGRRRTARPSGRSRPRGPRPRDRRSPRRPGWMSAPPPDRLRPPPAVRPRRSRRGPEAARREGRAPARRTLRNRARYCRPRLRARRTLLLRAACARGPGIPRDRRRSGLSPPFHPRSCNRSEGGGSGLALIRIGGPPRWKGPASPLPSASSRGEEDGMRRKLVAIGLAIVAPLMVAGFASGSADIQAPQTM